LERFCKDIYPHVIGGAVFGIDFSDLVVMLDEEVFCLDVFSLLGARNATIVLSRESVGGPAQKRAIFSNGP